MRLPLILALLVLSASSYADRTAPLPQGDDPAQAARPEPAPQLMHLERVLMQKQEARYKGGLPPEEYQQFVTAFREELAAVVGRIQPTAENKGLHAQILARLGQQEQGLALASLDQALARDPKSPALLVAKGSILYEKRDFQTADALALQAWEAGARRDLRAWALHKMSEGRVSGVSNGEPAPRLRPASDFARLDWSVPERHDINEQGSMQDLYQHAQANFAKHAETRTALDRAVAAKNAGRYQDALVWMQKAYDLFPNDRAYEALQVARKRAADAAARRADEQPATPRRSGLPPWAPFALFGVGAGLAGYGLYRFAKSRDGQASGEDGGEYRGPGGVKRAWSEQEFDKPRSTQEDLERVECNRYGLKVAGAAVAVSVAIVYGGGTLLRAAPTAVTLLRGGRESVQRLITSEAGAILPGEIRAAEEVTGNPASALNGAQLNRHLYQVGEYGKAGVRYLKNGRIRYYDVIDPAKKAGEMIGRRRVREWDPATFQFRTWMETLDHAGTVRIVRPETGGLKVHYAFDQAGNYAGTR